MEHQDNQQTRSPVSIDLGGGATQGLLMDSGSVVNILYWGAYHEIGLRRADLTSMTSPLYRFIGDSVILKGTIKLAITQGEPP